jgi:hypothetical protein
LVSWAAATATKRARITHYDVCWSTHTTHSLQINKAEKDWGSCLAHPKVGLQKPSCTKQRCMFQGGALGLFHLESSQQSQGSHSACINKLDSIEPYGRIPMPRMAQAPWRFVVKSPDGQGKANRSYPQETLR